MPLHLLSHTPYNNCFALSASMPSDDSEDATFRSAISGARALRRGVARSTATDTSARTSRPTAAAARLLPVSILN